MRGIHQEGPVIQRASPYQNSRLLTIILIYSQMQSPFKTKMRIKHRFSNELQWLDIQKYTITRMVKPAMGLRPSPTRFRGRPTQPVGYVVLTSLWRKGHWRGISGLIPGCTLFSGWRIEGYWLNDARWLSSSFLDALSPPAQQLTEHFLAIKHFHYWCFDYKSLYSCSFLIAWTHHPLGIDKIIQSKALYCNFR